MRKTGFRPSVLVFDMGNVLIRYVDFGPDSKITSKCSRGWNAVRELRDGEVRHRYERGELSTEEVFGEFVDKAGYADSRKSFETDFCEDLKMSLDKEVYDIVNAIKQKYDVDLLLLSNLNPLHYEYVQKFWPGVFSSMRKCFFSFEIGTRKPEEEAFRKVLDFLNLKIGYTCLFIDDAQKNLDTAKKLGFSVILHRNSEELKKELKGYNIEV